MRKKERKWMNNKYSSYSIFDSVSQACIDDTEMQRRRRARYFAQQNTREVREVRKNDFDGEILKAREARKNRWKITEERNSWEGSCRVRPCLSQDNTNSARPFSTTWLKRRWNYRTDRSTSQLDQLHVGNRRILGLRGVVQVSRCTRSRSRTRLSGARST